MTQQKSGATPWAVGRSNTVSIPTGMLMTTKEMHLRHLVDRIRGLHRFKMFRALGC